MKWRLQPYSSFARLVSAPYRLKLFYACLLLIFVCGYGTLELIRQQQRLTEITAENRQLTAEKQQKQQVITLLQHKADAEKNTLDPKIAIQIAPLDQRLQSAVNAIHGITVERQQWHFSATPSLQLELRGRFYALNHVLQQLQNEFHALKPLNLVFTHADNQPQTTLKLTLRFIKELDHAD
ncbi:hypothetical protein A1D23_04020 [Chelonobacter oris]|uniref:Uncharacterized protein n=1 Tax=Chelonobacter oris TaxID=505317 RepID=A0A0A3AKP7_9PAST|nr:hypothetical protein [Chelonobacter oris]KGQ69906.1 hypothetical protein OA57_09780 [Chelonobacter oris]MDH2999272.1 hypothetical protein [Chelonobacter oris]